MLTLSCGFALSVYERFWFNSVLTTLWSLFANKQNCEKLLTGSFNSANSALKKAKKRAVVDLALTLGSLSNCFTQDLEDDNNEQRASQLLSDSDFITPKQVKRIFAIASNNEITTDKAKSLLAEWGFSSTKEITQKDYDMVCEKLEKYGSDK